MRPVSSATMLAAHSSLKHIFSSQPSLTPLLLPMSFKYLQITTNTVRHPCKSPCLTQTQARSYYYTVTDSLVPEGATTSHFQSSSLISHRRKVLQEYSLAPLFSARISAILLGSTLSPRQFVQRKPILGALLDDILDFKPGTVTIGETQWLSNSAFPRYGTKEYRRVNNITGDVVANCLVAVYLPPDFEENIDALNELVEVGSQIADAVYGNKADRRLEEDCGITYCEFETPELNQHYFETMLGEKVDSEEALEVVSRWLDRLEAQRLRSEEAMTSA